MFREVADIQLPSMLNLNVPKLKGGKYKIVESVASESVEYMMQELAKRAEAIRAGNVDPTVDNLSLIHIYFYYLEKVRMKGEYHVILYKAWMGLWEAREAFLDGLQEGMINRQLVLGVEKDGEKIPFFQCDDGKFYIPEIKSRDMLGLSLIHIYCGKDQASHRILWENCEKYGGAHRKYAEIIGRFYAEGFG